MIFWSAFYAAVSGKLSMHISWLVLAFRAIFRSPTSEFLFQRNSKHFSNNKYFFLRSSAITVNSVIRILSYTSMFIHFCWANSVMMILFRWHLIVMKVTVACWSIVLVIGAHRKFPLTTFSVRHWYFWKWERWSQFHKWLVVLVRFYLQ